MMRCGLGMQQCVMHSATIQKTTFFELGVCMCVCVCLFVVCLFGLKRLHNLPLQQTLQMLNYLWTYLTFCE